MLVLALDTTTGASGLAIWRSGRRIDEVVLNEAGSRPTHAARLPQALVDLLGRHGLDLGDVDVYAVAAGPGSFTGLRIGMATMQGLAFARGRPMVAVSALDALALLGLCDAEVEMVGAWIDGGRDEVFSQCYARGPGPAPERTWRVLDGPIAARPAEVLRRWDPWAGSGRMGLVGDGVERYRAVILDAWGDRAVLTRPERPVVSAVAEIASRRAQAGETATPHGVRPIYVRRPDAEIARDRRRTVTSDE